MSWTMMRAGGWSYRLTDEDVLWAGRMAQCEGGDARDPAAALWTMTQLFSPRGQEEKYGEPNRFATFAELIRAYSQCINPRWRRNGDFCRDSRTDACDPAILDRRDRYAALAWEDLSPATRYVTSQWATGHLANPVPRAVEFADARTVATYVRTHPGSAYVARFGNHYAASSGSKKWPWRYVTMGAGVITFAAVGIALGGVMLYGWRRWRR